MFPRITHVRSGGKAYQYLRIVETYREGGRHHQRVVANLGRLDLLGDKLDRLVLGLRRYCQDRLVLPAEIRSNAAVAWGPILVARHLWDQMGLSEMIGRVCRSARRGWDVAETAFVLVANRLTEPTSEHGLARWLEHTYVCDREGRRWEPDWLPAEAVTKKHRVKVADRQLQRWYRTLDALRGAKSAIERELYVRVRDLFSLKVNVVFYDLTSTFFRRREPTGRLRRHGKSRDGKPREVQVVVGVVMANGWPIAHHVFPGNTADRSTWQAVAADIEDRFGLARVMLVADRGMVSPENLGFLSGRGFRYLVGIQGRRSGEAAAVLDALRTDPACWEQVDADNRVQEVVLTRQGLRYFVVESTPRQAYEQSLRERSMERTRAALERTREAVDAGRVKDPAKIGARAARAMGAHHGARYFRYEVPGPGQFHFQLDEAKLGAEVRREGRYVLKSDDPAITAGDAVDAYKELATVEAGFRDLKDVIAMRPIWHQCDQRIEAHIFVATLALFLKRTLQHHLDRHRIALSATDALAAMKSMGATELDLAGRRHVVVCSPGPDGRRVLKALGISQLSPPGPSPAS